MAKILQKCYEFVHFMNPFATFCEITQLAHRHEHDDRTETGSNFYGLIPSHPHYSVACPPNPNFRNTPIFTQKPVDSEL